MNISDSIKKLNVGVDKPVLEKNTSSTKSSEKTAAKAASTGTDSVTLSAASVQLQSDIATSEVFDASKVNEIKSTIERGEFSIDTGKVADGLLKTVQELIQSQ